MWVAQSKVASGTHPTTSCGDQVLPEKTLPKAGPWPPKVKFDDTQVSKAPEEVTGQSETRALRVIRQ